MAIATCRLRRLLRPILLVWGGLVSFVGAQTVINVPPDPVPEGVRSSTELNLPPGGDIPFPFYIGRPIDVNEKIQVNIRGGSLGNGIAAYGGATIDVESGSIGTKFRLWPGNRLNVSGGSVGERMDLIDGAELLFSGGRIGREISLFADSVMTLHGDAFFLDGEPVGGLTENGDRLVVDDRQGKTLTGRLVDGHHFSFTLDSRFGGDYFHEQATVELVLSPGDALACDFDDNRECDISDLNPLVGAVGTNDLRFDIDGSGEVDDGDIQTWLASAGDLRIGRSYPMGDATLDGVVDQKDLNVVGLNWQSNVAR